MIATFQEHYCKGRAGSIFANAGGMTGLADDTQLLKDLVKWTKLPPTALAKRAGMAATTITRPYNGTAATRISTPTLEKLRKTFPDFPGFGVEADQLEERQEDDWVVVERLPTFAGMGGGGTGDAQRGSITFSRSLIERDLRAQPEDLLAIEAEGNSMEPDYQGGDQILIDTRRLSLAAPGAFCLWDGDGYVVKYLERIPGTEPARVRIISRNSDLYPTYERLVEECEIKGRVVWFGRQVR